MEPIAEDKKPLLAQIAALNRKLLTLARTGDWQQVQALERQRRALVKSLFAGRLEAVEPRVIQCVQEVVQVDREIVKLSLIERRRAGAQVLRKMISSTSLLPK
jgi:hypothetical protein